MVEIEVDKVKYMIAVLFWCVQTVLSCEVDLTNWNMLDLEECFHFCWVFDLEAGERDLS